MARAGRPSSLIWLQGLLCGALVTLATPLALLLGVLLAPVLAAAWLDRLPGKPRARAAFVCGLIPCIAPIRMLWAAGGDLPSAWALVTDPSVPATAWLAAAAGWLLAELAPLGLRLGLEVSHRARAVRLAAARDRLREQWPGE